MADLTAKEWALKNIEEVFKELDANPNVGLTSEKAKEKLEKFGENRLVKEREESLIDVLKEEITEPMILLLLSVGVLYSVWGSLQDSVTIFTIIIILVLIEVYNEFKAKRSIEALKKLTLPSVLVFREGALKEIPATQLVPGDLLPLKAGQRVPADTRLVKSYGLQIDESSLTGESFPVFKDANARVTENAEIDELTNLVFAGTQIIQGEGTAVVVATGRNTEIGRVAGIAEAVKEPKTPLQLSMRELSKTLVWIALFFSLVIPILGFLRGQPLDIMIMTGLSLAFATIPEELPIIITMVLGVGAYALSRKNALVKRFRAAETLGSVTVIATDKTGTITENRMTLEHVYFDGELTKHVGDNSEKQFLGIGILATGVLAAIGHEETRHWNPMGVAILEAADKAGVDGQAMRDNYVLLNEFTFDNKLKIASYIYQHHKDLYLFSSGATEVLIEKSKTILNNDKEKIFTIQEKEKTKQTLTEITMKGERTLAFAYRHITKEEKSRDQLENELTFVGFVSFIDPPRSEVRDVVHMCKEAGIRVIMLTGDHPNTAKAIAAQVEIENTNLLTGNEISKMDDEQLKQTLGTTSIFARITPEHKLRIVRLLREIGEAVAVTGDGVNDAPALQEAEIGIAMGLRGTDVAKENADMILTDDNFVTIAQAIREGRKIFDNLKKGVRYYLAVKVALVITFLLPIMLGIPLPFPPIQIILLELFMDLAASTAFVAEKEEPDIMKQPSRNPKEKFMTKTMLASIFISALSLSMAVSTCYFLTYYWTSDVAHAQTAAFASWILAHIFLAFNLRSERRPVLSLGVFSNKVMVGWAVVAIAMLLLGTTVPVFQSVIKMSLLLLSDWILVIVVAFAATSWIEIAKWVRLKI